MRGKNKQINLWVIKKIPGLLLRNNKRCEWISYNKWDSDRDNKNGDGI